jgi:hypothetical protein
MPAWMSDLAPYMTTIIVAALILAALVVLLLLFKLFRTGVRGRKGSRIGISEYYEIDKSRRLVLVRRDDIEHLILIGGGEDVVVESNIGSPLTTVSTAPQQPHIQMSTSPLQQPPRPPRPPIFASRRPELRSVSDDDQN